MSEIIERLARAILSAPRPIVTGKELSVTIGDLFDVLDAEDYLHSDENELLARHIVRIVLAELREPTDEMLEAAMVDNACVYDGMSASGAPAVARGTWQSMIDAALKSRG